VKPEAVTVTVKVAGKNYQLSGMEEAAHFERLAEMTDRRIRETTLQNPALGDEACAVAAALSLADELVKAQQVASLLRKQLEGLARVQLDEA